MNILEEFWYGNIEPAEYDTSSGKEYKELLQLISRNEDKLLATMTEEQKELFTKYADCVRKYQVTLDALTDRVVHIGSTVEPNPDLFSYYETKYQIYRTLYPTLEHIFSILES